MQQLQCSVLEGERNTMEVSRSLHTAFITFQQNVELVLYMHLSDLLPGLDQKTFNFE